MNHPRLTRHALLPIALILLSLIACRQSQPEKSAPETTEKHGKKKAKRELLAPPECKPDWEQFVQSFPDQTPDPNELPDLEEFSKYKLSPCVDSVLASWLLTSYYLSGQYYKDEAEIFIQDQQDFAWELIWNRDTSIRFSFLQFVDPANYLINEVRFDPGYSNGHENSSITFAKIENDSSAYLMHTHWAGDTLFRTHFYTHFLDSTKSGEKIDTVLQLRGGEKLMMGGQTMKGSYSEFSFPYADYQPAILRNWIGE